MVTIGPRDLESTLSRIVNFSLTACSADFASSTTSSMS